MDDFIPARSLGDLKGERVKTFEVRQCSTCTIELSRYNPNTHCGACFASGKVELK